MKLLAGLATLLLLASGPVRAGEITVFGAASLTEALTEVAALYEAGGRDKARLAFAASSTLARQIEAGAAADVIAAASDDWMDYLELRGLIEADTRIAPIGNRLVLVVPAASPVVTLEIDDGFDLAGLLRPGERLALGDPQHVPAGIYARQALENLGQWEALSDRLAPAASVRAALALVERNETPFGIVYATDAAIAAGVRVVGVFPDSSHAAIGYPMALVAGRRSADAEAFLAFLAGDAAAAVFAAHGFTLR